MEINELFLNRLGFTKNKYWLKTTIGKLKTDITSYFSLIPNEILHEIYKYIRFDIYPYKLFKTIDFCIIYDHDYVSVIHSNNININNNHRLTLKSYNNKYSLFKHYYHYCIQQINCMHHMIDYHKYIECIFEKTYNEIFKIQIYKYPTTDFYHSLLHTKIMNDIKND